MELEGRCLGDNVEADCGGGLKSDAMAVQD